MRCCLHRSYLLAAADDVVNKQARSPPVRPVLLLRSLFSFSVPKNDEKLATIERASDPTLPKNSMRNGMCVPAAGSVRDI